MPSVRGSARKPGIEFCCSMNTPSYAARKRASKSLPSKKAGVFYLKIMSSENQLDQLKKFTKVVADSGDFATLKQFAPQDATTNPSLIFKAAQKPEYQFIVDKAIADNKAKASGEKLLRNVMDDLLILFGLEIL